MKQAGGKSLSRFAHEQLETFRRKAARENAHELGQEWHICLGQQLLDSLRELENVRWPCGARTLAGSSDDAVTLHRRDVRPHGVRREAELSGNLINCEAAVLEKRHDSTSARIEKLLSQHRVS
jgi:hypothetical protein